MNAQKSTALLTSTGVSHKRKTWLHFTISQNRTELLLLRLLLLTDGLVNVLFADVPLLYGQTVLAEIKTLKQDHTTPAALFNVPIYTHPPMPRNTQEQG